MSAGLDDVMVQAMLVPRFGGPEVMEAGEVAIPVPRGDELLVRVLAAGVGPWDAHLRRGSWTGELPYVPGGEFAGVVVGDTGAGAAFEDGTPVYGYRASTLDGCYAEYLTCDVERLAPIPAGLDAVEAAATPIAALTAFQGVTDILGVTAGQQVLVTAAAGGVGHFAVQMARLRDAIVTATASPRHHEFVHQLGAAVVVDHTAPDWPDRVREVTGGGAERVLACAAPTLPGAARAARDGAVIATPVHAELPEGGRVRWVPYDGTPSGSHLIRMAPWFDDGSLSVRISGRYFWHEAAEAHRVVEEGHTEGKLVLVVDEDLAAALEV
jgi:NADPH:quinone reductase-like Zn-dependent oxidoreductase